MKSVLISIRPQWVEKIVNGLIHNGIYYTEERARRKLEQVNGD